MSEFDDLRDLGKLKVTPIADQALTALSRATGKSKQAIAREWIDEKARQLIHEATLVVRLTRDKGSAE